MNHTTQLLALVDTFPQRGSIDFDTVADREFIIEVFQALRQAAPEIRESVTAGNPVIRVLPTSQTQTEGQGDIPSNAAPTPPETERSNHTQASIQNTDGNATEAGPAAGNAGTSAVVGDMSLPASIRREAKRKGQARSSSRASAKSDPVVPPEEPQATAGISAV